MGTTRGGGSRRKAWDEATFTRRDQRNEGRFDAAPEVISATTRRRRTVRGRAAGTGASTRTASTPAVRVGPVRHCGTVATSAVDPSCAFCAIIGQGADASVVYEDAQVVSFLDIRPVTRGDLLVVPKAHVSGLEDLDEQTGAHVFRVAHRLARALRRSGLPCEGVNFFLADGEAAFQTVFHTHLHVFPRVEGDGFRLDVAWRERTREQLDDDADHVRRGLGLLTASGGTHGLTVLHDEADHVAPPG